MSRARKYPKELIERGVRLALESRAAGRGVARDLGIGHETLRKRVRQAEADGGCDRICREARSARRSSSSGRIRAASRERDLEGGLGVFREGARRRPNEVSAFIDEHRERFGVEPICRTLDVSASAYYQRATGERSARVVEDERLTGGDPQVHEANYECYGYRRMWTRAEPGRARPSAVTRSRG